MRLIELLRHGGFRWENSGLQIIID